MGQGLFCRVLICDEPTRGIDVGAKFEILIAVGMTFVLITAGIDLSVGSVLALSGGVLGVAMVQWHWPVWAAMIACVLVGAARGPIGPAIGLLQESTVIFAINTAAFYAFYVDLLTRPVRAIRASAPFPQRS